MRKAFQVPLEQVLFWILSLGSLLFIYFPLLVHDPILSWDDEILLAPLKKVKALSDFFNLFILHQNIDVQPIRDISLIIDRQIEEFLGWKIHHWHNLILWEATCFLVYKIFKLFLKNEFLIKIFIFLYSIYPTMAVSVSWISARKHLLAYFFVLLLTLNFLRWMQSPSPSFSWKVMGKLSLYYLLSIYSQPIFCLWPLWACSYLLIKRVFRSQVIDSDSFLLTMLPLVFLMGINLFINYLYYRHSYFHQYGQVKFSSGLDLGNSLLILGRSFMQLVFPVYFAATYDGGSPLGLIGIGLFVLFIYGSIKLLSSSKEQVLIWLSFYLFSLVLVSFNKTNVFVSDTYLLSPSLAIFILMGMSAEKLKGHFDALIPRFAFYTVGGVLFLSLIFSLIFKSKAVASMWMSDYSLKKTSYETEKSCDNIRLYSTWLFNHHQPQEGLQVGRELIKRMCVTGIYHEIFATILLHEPQLSFEQKMKLLTPLRKKSYVTDMTIAAVYLQGQHERESFDLALPILQDSQTAFENGSQHYLIKIFSEYCAKRKNKDRQDLQDQAEVCSQLKARYP